MDRVGIEEVDAENHDGSESRKLSEALGATDVAINHYRIPPGGGTPSGLHAHADQEEVFLVLAGMATFERPEGTVTVGEHEGIRFAPGEFQTCVNRSAAELVVLAIGAPPDSTDVRIPATCPECGQPELGLATDRGELTFECPGCESEYVPVPCPECGSEDLAMRRVDAAVCAVCGNCGEGYERPPIDSVE